MLEFNIKYYDKIYKFGTYINLGDKLFTDIPLLSHDNTVKDLKYTLCKEYGLEVNVDLLDIFIYGIKLADHYEVKYLHPADKLHLVAGSSKFVPNISLGELRDLYDVKIDNELCRDTIFYCGEECVGKYSKIALSKISHHFSNYFNDVDTDTLLISPHLYNIFIDIIPSKKLNNNLSKFLDILFSTSELYNFEDCTDDELLELMVLGDINGIEVLTGWCALFYFDKSRVKNVKDLYSKFAILCSLKDNLKLASHLKRQLMLAANIVLVEQYKHSKLQLFIDLCEKFVVFPQIGNPLDEVDFWYK